MQVSKSEFAKRARRNPSQVTRWIAGGKLTPPALRDDGSIDLELGLARDLGSIFTDLESWVMTAGQDLADALGVDHRAATLVVRKSLHKFRAQQAEKRRGEAEAMPELLEQPPLAAE